MRKHVWLVALVAAGITIGGAAVADEESDRKDLIEDIDEKVEDVGDELSGFESDSDVGDLDDALSYAREVKDLVSKLERVKQSDSRANDLVSRYPGYVDSFREAARYLKRMKEGQRLADGVADKCASDEADLQTVIRMYLGTPDDADDGPAKLSERGKRLGQTWGERLGKLKDNDREMASAASSARFSISDGEWSGVSSSFGNASSGITSYWKERYQAADRACDRLALGEAHPDIKKAIDELGKHKGDTKATYRQLKSDYDAWKKDVQKLREFSEKTRDDLRTTICTAGEYEVEQKVKEVADRWAGQISSVYGTTLGLADRLQQRAEGVVKRAPKSTPRLQAALKANVESLAKLKDYELLGSNNPKVRTRIEWGKKRHDDLQGGLGCTFAEFSISSSYCDNTIRPGSGCRLDCLKVSGSTCKITEVKPDSDGGKREGPVQVRAYKAGLEKWYREDKAKLFERHKELMACENSDKTGLNVETDVVFYEFCSGTVKDELGFVIKELSDSVPDEAQ